MIGKKINALLEPLMNADANFAQHCKLTYPIKPSSIRRWMDDLNFKHCPSKKSYVIDIHEREDVRIDRKK